MAASAVIAAVGLALAIGMAAKGLSDQKKAKKIAAGNIRPTYSIAPEETANQEIAQTLAGRGLSGATKQSFRTSAERGLSTSIDAILKGGGDTNQVGQVYGTYNDSMGRLAIADDAQRFDNLKILLDNNRRMAAERDKLFQLNEYAPFADKAQEAAALSAQGQQYINSGINTGFNAVSTYATGASQRKSTNRMKFGTSDEEYTGDNQYSPSLMNSGTGQSYLNDRTYNFSRLTPQQRSDISGLYSNRYR